MPKSEQFSAPAISNMHSNVDQEPHPNLHLQSTERLRDSVVSTSLSVNLYCVLVDRQFLFSGI